MILQELLSTSSLMDTRVQAIKVSQCVQIGSNIIYGYYDLLDNLGLMILVKMMASVKVSWEDGRGFEELDEVTAMSDKLYTEQRLIHSYASFTKTIQACVQCANSLLADMEQPQEERSRKPGKAQERGGKMIDYILGKVAAILDQNNDFVSQQWNYLTGFWISFCSTRNSDVRTRTLAHLATLFPRLLLRQAVAQDELLAPYFELAKLQFPEMGREVVEQVKALVGGLTEEDAIL